MGNSKENAIKMVEIKDTISKKNLLDSLINRLYTTEERITELDRAIEITQLKHKVKKMEKQKNRTKHAKTAEQNHMV